MIESLKKLVKGNSIEDILLTGFVDIEDGVAEIILYNLEEELEEYLICDAIQITLANGQVIFLDPSYYFGINIGGEEQIIRNEHSCISTACEFDAGDAEKYDQLFPYKEKKELPCQEEFFIYSHSSLHS